MMNKQIYLVPDFDHSYRSVRPRENTKVVYNDLTAEYYEYHGEEYLGEGDVVIEATVLY